MTLPTIHSNGTSVQTLIDGYDAIDEAIYRLTLKWSEVEFNARDYYVKGPQEWPQAVDERLQQSANIRSLRDYINGIRQHLYDQLP
jgi:hypothetical protein